MNYVDGYVLPVPKKNLPAYRRIAQKAGKIWREHGALEYRECVGDDLGVKWGVTFPRQLKLKPGETVVFSWIGFIFLPNLEQTWWPPQRHKKNRILRLRNPLLFIKDALRASRATACLNLVFLFHP